ncbi:MAG: hypothetical protein ACXWYO_07780 [Gaiellaceae bacterium]
MRRFRISLVAVAVVALTAATAASALVPKKVPFTAKYSGQASTKVEGDVANISATGTGSATLIGAGKITGTGTGDSSKQPCVPFGGTGSMTGAKGLVAFKLTSGASGCGDEGGHVFSIKGYVTVTRATGKLAKAKGTLKFTGVYNRDDGSFSVKFTGTLKK